MISSSSSSSSSPIAEVEVIPLATPAVNPNDLDGSFDTVLVRVHDEAGNIGVGETDAPAGLVMEFINMADLHEWSRGLKSVLVGEDPFPISSLHDRLYAVSIYPGRRGLGIHAISALDIALHDLVGKQVGRPAHDLLGGARRDYLRPYGTVWPGLPDGRPISEVMGHVKETTTPSSSASYMKAGGTSETGLR
jgi:L-alanine-DL-glutamate epimerase-like enolase superfamily enzyme